MKLKLLEKPNKPLKILWFSFSMRNYVDEMTRKYERNSLSFYSKFFFNIAKEVAKIYMEQLKLIYMHISSK